MHEERPDIEGILHGTFAALVEAAAIIGFVVMAAVWIIIATPVPA